MAAPTSAAGGAPSQARVLRRLFLTLFLRGRSSRGLEKKSVPTSIGRKLALTISMYALFGCYATVFLHQGVFLLSAYLHAMTFMFLGMFVAASAGEILFNKEEADILLHRPVDSRVLLWAKVRVLVEISLWLAFAFNLAGFCIGLWAQNGGWRYPPAHALSTILEAFFCCGCVVLVYQLCLRWFGRQRLEGLMTIAQIVVAVTVVVAGQLLPQLAFQGQRIIQISEKLRWLVFLPPAWFAGLDDALAGSGGWGSWVLGGLAMAATGTILVLAFGKLARGYEMGLQALGETVSAGPARRGGRRWAEILLSIPPWRWWCREPVARASFLLTAAYLARDRDTKLRIYPSIAPIIIMPVVMLMNDMRQNAGAAGFSVAFAGGFLGLTPSFALMVLQYTQQWQAADVFRTAPLGGPAALCHGARRAVLSLVTLPMCIVFVLITWFMLRDKSLIVLLVPGLVALPVYALCPGVMRLVPLTQPPEEAKAASRGLAMVGVMMVSFGVAAVATLAWSMGWFYPFVATEAVIVAVVYAGLRVAMRRMGWAKMER